MRHHYYEIRVVGMLGDSWIKWFDGLTIHHDKDKLSGEVFSILAGSMDQVALHGVLMRIRDLNLTLVAVNRIDEKGL